MKFLIIQETDWEVRGPHQQHHLMERLANQNHEIRVVDYEILWNKKINKRYYTKKKKFLANPKIFKNSKIRVIRPASLNIPILSYLSTPIFHFFSIFQEIKNYKPDFIFGFSIFNSFIGLFFAKIFKIPFYYYLIDHLHTLVPIKMFQPIAKLIESLNIQRCDKLYVINKGLIDYSLGLGGNVEKSIIITGGVDLDRYKPNQIIRKEIREELEILPKDIVLMFMGWLYNFSGLKEITDFIVKDENLLENYRLLIVGDGDLFNYINIKKKELKNPQKIILTGRVPFDSIPNYLHAADFCILPAYKNEIMNNIVPIKLYEYIASGKPVIATKLEGIYKDFGNDNGILYIDYPTEVFEKSKIDKKSYNEVVSNGQNFILDYDWIKIVNKFIDSLL